MELSIRFLTSDIIGTIGVCGLRNVPHINKTWNYGALLFTIFPALSYVLFYWFFFTQTHCSCAGIHEILLVALHFSMKHKKLGANENGRKSSLIMQKFQFYYDFYLTWLMASLRKERKSFNFNINLNLRFGIFSRPFPLLFISSCLDF